ncbi:DUF2283 domain-containing protein [Nocardia mangyaensis]|uniref:DUF2283 domain-containing protein n=1 Tax=Nocardia mangyaensis TaxID=2213200 RepID=UPI002676CC98|nr:DUF2283 domain-containing protein [Nocardia mangyaensis]MDO3648171.1 DUF2283 domain-containing protein [Nocardia mangyaensis]
MTYDSAADAAMIYLADHIGPGQAVRQQAVPLDRAEMILDFDVQGMLVGIEVIGARETLAAEVLDAAEQIG